MRWPYLAFGTILAAGLFSSCGTTGNTASTHGRNPHGTGPFDSHGNYIEALADNPPSKSQPVSTPNDEPPPDAVPLPPAGSSSSVATTKSHPVEVASRTKHAASSSKTKHTETVSRVKEEEPPTKSKTKHTSTASRGKETETLPKTKHTKATAETSTKSKHAATASTESSVKGKHAKVASDTTVKSKKKTTTEDATATSKTKSAKEKTAKAKSTKAKSSGYTVKPGDSLERIARHNHTSVGALKKANSSAGDGTLHPGKKLVIPQD